MNRRNFPRKFAWLFGVLELMIKELNWVPSPHHTRHFPHIEDRADHAPRFPQVPTEGYSIKGRGPQSPGLQFYASEESSLKPLSLVRRAASIGSPSGGQIESGLSCH